MAIDDLDVITTTVNYFVPPADGSKPWFDSTKRNATNDGPATNFTSEGYKVQIENVRGKEDKYTLDKTGFQFFNAPTKMKGSDFDDVKNIEEIYYPEQIELIKKLTGATKVVLFDHTVRRNFPGNKGDDPSKRTPVIRAHIDQSTKAATARVHRHLPPSEVPALLQKRYQIINLWRPINHPAIDHPLALCDYYTLDQGTGVQGQGTGDLVPTALRYPDRDGETLSVKYNPDHRWKYLKGMKPDEIVLIKCSDSIDDGSVAVCTPHTSFVDPTTPPTAKGRESIEMRTLVFYD